MSTAAALRRTSTPRHKHTDEDAERYRAIVAENPDNTEALFLLGLIALRQGDPENAIKYLEQACRIRRAHAPYHEGLATAYRAANRLCDARRAAEHALELKPRSLNAERDLTLIALAEHNGASSKEHLKKLGKQSAAQLGAKIWLRLALLGVPFAALSRLTRSPNLSPAAAQALARADTLLRHGEEMRAELAMRQALEAAPNYVAALLKLAKRHADRERYADALPLLEKAAQEKPRSVDVLAPLSQALGGVGRPREALNRLEEAPEDARTTVTFARAQGWALYREGRGREAVSAFEAARGMAPKNPGAAYGHARALESTGQLDEAERALNDALTLEPGHARALRALADNKRMTPGDRHFEKLTKLLEKRSLPQNIRAVLHFAAGAVYRHAGDVEVAFSHYRRANDLMDVTYNPAVWADYVDQYRATFDAAFFARMKGLGSDSELPVFIVGMPRSGTTLTEQIIASHPLAAGGGERDTVHILAHKMVPEGTPYPGGAKEVGQTALRETAAAYLDDLRSVSSDAQRVTDKMPRNFLHLGLIAALFPNARVINCRRDPMDICLSIYFQSFAGHHPYAYSLENLGHYYRHYERLMAHWRDVLPLDILDVQYEEVVADQRGMTEKILAHCGLDWDERCLAFHETDRAVRTASYAQVREPIYASAVKRWKAYAHHLKPLEEALAATD